MSRGGSEGVAVGRDGRPRPGAGLRTPEIAVYAMVLTAELF